ncbi:MAG: hypothetical protein ACPGOV_07585 [Magnetovibrionaceae bacterium]
MSDIADDWPYMRKLQAGLDQLEKDKARLDPVVSLIESDDDADFLRRLTATVLFAESYKVTKMTVAFRTGNRLREEALKRSRGIRTYWEVAADAPALGLLDWFDVGWDAPASCKNEDWKELDLGATNLILHHKLLDLAMAEPQPRRPALSGWQPGNGGPILSDADLTMTPVERCGVLCAASGLITGDRLNRALAGSFGLPVAITDEAAGSPWFEGDLLVQDHQDKDEIVSKLSLCGSFAPVPEHRAFEVTAG